MTFAQKYATFFETIDKNTQINQYKLYFDENCSFKDPFHSVIGIENIFKIFENMYQNLNNPYFVIEEIFEQDNIAFIQWKFYFSFKYNKKIESFTGLSKVIFNENQTKVISHEDFWDASQNIYEKLPLIKHIIKFIRKRIQN